MSPRAERFVNSRTREELRYPRCGADRLVLEHPYRDQPLEAAATCPACGHEWATSTRHLVRPDRFTWKPGELELRRRAVDGEDLDYLDDVPREIPEGRIVVHNRVRPASRLGDRGFRAWTEPAGTANRVRCDCPWASHLPEHYRVQRPAAEPSDR